MTTSINPASTPLVNPAYPKKDVNVGTEHDKGNSSGTSPVTGHQHGHAGGAFMQSVLQALQGLGLSLPTASTNASGSASSSSAVTGTHSVSATAGSAATGATTATNGADSDGDNDNSGSSSATANLGQLLHTFMHDLFQALKSQPQASGATGADSDGDNDNSGSKSAPGLASGYNNFNSNLTSLISALTPAGSGATSDAASSSSSTTSNSPVSQLQSDFSALVSALHGQTGASTATAPTLLAFLKALENKNGGSTPITSGGIVSTTA